VSATVLGQNHPIRAVPPGSDWRWLISVRWIYDDEAPEEGTMLSLVQCGPLHPEQTGPLAAQVIDAGEIETILEFDRAFDMDDPGEAVSVVDEIVERGYVPHPPLRPIEGLVRMYVKVEE